jgi:nickel-dependent lactate racemase
MAGLNFIINVVCNSRNEIVGAVAGDPVLAHQAGIQFGDREVWGADSGEGADIVIASPGRNKDRYFYTSLRCLHNAHGCLRKEGTVILIASCDGGWTDPKYLERKWQVSEEILEYSTNELIRLVECREWCTPDRQFQALVFFVQNIYRLCREMHVYITGASDVSRSYAEKLGLLWRSSVEEALEEAIGHYTPKARVTVIPDYFITPITSSTGASGTLKK